MDKFHPVIKWSGSKRSQAKVIKGHLPNFNHYYEPFVGGGAIAYSLSPDSGTCGDIFKPLIDLWKLIQTDYEVAYEEYEKRWERLQNEGHQVFYEIRNNFNQHYDSNDLLFLSRTCVNGLIRFNQKGEFNNSLHLSRKGIEPKRLRKIMASWSERIKGINYVCGDYWETTQDIKKNDFVYLDPPYFHTKGRYFGTIDYNRFLDYLDWLNRKDVKYALSFDGIRGDKDFIVEVPNNLYKKHILISSGNSSFKKIMDKKIEDVYESLYLNY